MKNILLVAFVISSFSAGAQIKILFDATKAESAGNADWVIDADSHNISFSNGPAVAGSGSESNPQKIPTPPQGNITASTSETYWDGGLSNWAIDCVKAGYVVETLPYNGQITYGVTSNVQDLSHYKVFVIDEPNIAFTASEKAAIITFVQNGGGLCIISDHTISDRNNDGVDSPQVLNDLMSNNSIQNNPFGISYDYNDINQTSSNIANLPGNPILHGTAGNVTQVKWSDGTTMTLNTTQNNTATGLVYKTGASATGTTNVLFASATYQNGKVIAIGDSSIPDDGSGDSGDTLYNGYIDDAGGNHQKILMNAIIWLATPNPLGIDDLHLTDIKFTIAPNPIQNKMLRFKNADSAQPVTLTIFDALGRKIQVDQLNSEELNHGALAVDELNSGIYFCQVSEGNKSKILRFTVQ
ncbi:MAG: T9SS type A sorting domain-containing protein [Flavobacterium sp.]|nr:MAG: T9SS type A sorting domain-containing protein [Flavobacterium sp.]